MTRGEGRAAVVDDDGRPVGRVKQVGSGWQAWKADTFVGWGARRKDAVALFEPLGNVGTTVCYRIPAGWGMGVVIEADADTCTVDERYQIDRKPPHKVAYLRDTTRCVDRASAFPPTRRPARRPGETAG